MKKIILFTLTIFLLSNCGSTQNISSDNPLAQGVPFELTESNFKKSVLENEKLSVVYFWAEWCGPCRMVKPVMKKVAKEEAGKTGFGKVDVDSNRDIAIKYNIRSIPTILFIKGEEVLDKHVGVISKEELRKKIKEHSL